MIKEITEALESIGWSVDDDKLNRFIRNPKGKRTNLILRTEGIQLEFENIRMWGEGGSGCMYFGYEEMQIRALGNSCISLGANNHTFLQFYNYDITK